MRVASTKLAVQAIHALWTGAGCYLQQTILQAGHATGRRSSEGKLPIEAPCRCAPNVNKLRASRYWSKKLTDKRHWWEKLGSRRVETC